MTRRAKQASLIGLAVVVLPILLSAILPPSDNLEMMVGGMLILFAPPYALLVAFLPGEQGTSHFVISALANAALFGLGGMTIDWLGGRSWPITMTWIIYLSLLVVPW